ncbi:hypothetical protein TcasGA2_TC032015 [Tribolium castaneum]|uniref:Uncharacterized protein n=1 Tax=Tribolium castaneum TaxID=7070 RepID=A0A139WN62_TRICA|nr:hypothetical protein TcasGA2_TC032015 [Tribolium castaneum]
MAPSIKFYTYAFYFISLLLKKSIKSTKIKFSGAALRVQAVRRFGADTIGVS